MDDTSILVPICPACERPMTLASTAKRAFIIPELRKFECTRCAITATAEEVTWEAPEATRSNGS
jgi:hypothetical protein